MHQCSLSLTDTYKHHSHVHNLRKESLELLQIRPADRLTKHIVNESLFSWSYMGATSREKYVRYAWHKSYLSISRSVQQQNVIWLVLKGEITYLYLEISICDPSKKVLNICGWLTGCCTLFLLYIQLVSYLSFFAAILFTQQLMLRLNLLK